MKPIQNLYKELCSADDQNLIHARIVQFPRIEIVFRKNTPFDTVAKIKEYVDKTYPIHNLHIGEYISPSHKRHLTLYMEVKQFYQGA
jgi:hypothetical protein